MLKPDGEPGTLFTFAVCPWETGPLGILFCLEYPAEAGDALEGASCCTCNPALLTGEDEAGRPAMEEGLLVLNGFAGIECEDGLIDIV